MSESKLLQIHHQFADHNELLEQNTVKTNVEFNKWFSQVKKEHPLPKGAEYLICAEESEHFVTAVDLMPVPEKE